MSVALVPDHVGPEQPTLLRFGSDVQTRLRFFGREAMAHPAKMNLNLLGWIVAWYTRPGDVLCDPMAGSGGILLAATMQRHVMARDVEPAYLAMMHHAASRILSSCGLFAGSITVGQHDARQPWGLDAQLDAIITSPPYANDAGHSAGVHKGILSPRLRAALPDAVPHHARWDQLNAGQHGALAALRFRYGSPGGGGEHPDQIGHFRGARYWQAMEAVYRNAYAALRHGGLLICVIKDHIKDGRRVPVALLTLALCERLGFVLVAQHRRLVYPLSLWMRRRKERGLPVVEEEDIFCLRKEGA
jgi:DNA modification methylase